MITVNIHEAKTQLSKLIDRAVKGEWSVKHLLDTQILLWCQSSA